MTDNIIKFPKGSDESFQEDYEKALEYIKTKKVSGFFIVTIMDDEKEEPLYYYKWKSGSRLRLVGGIEVAKISSIKSIQEALADDGRI